VTWAVVKEVHGEGDGQEVGESEGARQEDRLGKANGRGEGCCSTCAEMQKVKSVMRTPYRCCTS